MERGRNRRRNYFIDKSFQSKFIIKFCLIVILASLLTGALIYYFNQESITVAFEDLKVVAKSTSAFILPATLEIIAIVTFLVALAIILMTLFTSHKIAGPLYRLKAELEKIKGGDFSSDIQLRARDQLQRLAGDFNEMRVGLGESIETIRKDWSSVKTSLDRLKDNIDNKEEKRRILESINKIDSELSKFKTK